MLLLGADAPPPAAPSPSVDADSTFSTWARFPESKRELNSSPPQRSSMVRPGKHPPAHSGPESWGEVGGGAGRRKNNENECFGNLLINQSCS